MKIKNGISEMSFRSINTVFMIIVIFSMGYPLFHIGIASISDPFSIMAHTGLLLKPLGKATFTAYKMVFNNPMIVRGYLNTIYVVVVGVLISIILTSLGAYFLSRKDVFWKKHIMLMIVFTMFFNGGLIPLYLTVRDLGLDNTLWSLIMPTAINTFNLIVMRTAFMSIPDSIGESAMLDGAGHWRILFRIILPMSLPVIAVITLYYTVERWNGWFHASIFIRERSLLPLQVILREILMQNDTGNMTAGVTMYDEEAVSDTVKYAVIMVATLPIISVYPFLQKYFVKGLMVGSVKG